MSKQTPPPNGKTIYRRVDVGSLLSHDMQEQVVARPRGEEWRKFNARPAVGGYDERTGKHWGAYNKGPGDK